MTEIDSARSHKGRPNYTPEFRREVAIAACESGISVAKLAQSRGLNPNMVFKWRRQYRAGLLDSKTVSEAAAIIRWLDYADPGMTCPLQTGPAGV
ncbi:transposase [Paraburkholderia aromaticivorans]|uniref:Transposase n=1 Tax=Paraburkholderia aromaticivorans TaxID=2026199 RepID=A0A248VZQ3_9BURK|nr:transposase [Paraburkholderia aromaticivorans]ASW04002.1 hypothetical protein CJU94_38365 [Paraburkholderia aromaticivorans]